MSASARASGGAHDRAPVVEARDLTRIYEIRRGLLREPAQLQAVGGVSFAIEAGRTLAVVGESGCGKSTLARVVVADREADRGRRCGSRGIDAVDARRRRQRHALRKTVQMVFQNPYGSLNPRKKIGAILEAPLEINTDARAGRARASARARCWRKVGLRPEHYVRYPHMFSGGQRQRIAIARALMLNPALVVADEPVSALDVSVQAQVLNLLADLQRELGLAYLFISHDLGVVRHIAHEVLVMYLGLAMEQGPKERIFARPLHPYTQALLASTPGMAGVDRVAAHRAQGRAAVAARTRRRAACSPPAARTRSSAAAPSGRRCARSTAGRSPAISPTQFLESGSY